MRVVNIHRRSIHQPKAQVSKLFQTLATSEDKIWPSKNWPAMQFKNGINIGSNGGHGLIRYDITEFKAGHNIKFKFTKPNGFHGTHELRISSISEDTSEIVHNITMNTTFKASILWIFVIRWLHDALIEEAFDNVENYFSEEKKITTYNLWVIFLRSYYKRKSFQIKQA